MEMLQCSRRHVQYLRDENLIEFYQTGRTIRYKIEHVEAFLNEGMVRSVNNKNKKKYDIGNNPDISEKTKKVRSLVKNEPAKNLPISKTCHENLLQIYNGTHKYSDSISNSPYLGDPDSELTKQELATDIKNNPDVFLMQAEWPFGDKNELIDVLINEGFDLQKF